MKKNISETQKVLNVWAVILIVWSFYRYKFSLPVWFDEIIAKPLLFITPVFLYNTHYAKESFLKSLWISKKNLISDLPYGVIIGIMFIVSALLSLFFRNNNLSQIPTNISLIGSAFFISLCTGISEEILSRGFILKKLYEDSKNMLSSSFTATILFFLIHIPILFTMRNLTGSLLLMFVFTNVVLSLANSFLFLSRRSLVLPILINTFYNTVIIVFTQSS